MADLKKLPLTSMDIPAEQLRKLKELFPEIFTEGNKIDWNKLKLTLGEQIDVGKERYGMNWPGKADCFKTIQQQSIATLVPCPEESVDFEKTENCFIEGDNLEALKLLQKSYSGKVKMIYIDPPYNTGKDFIYPDNYAENLETYLSYTEQVDENGRKFATNTDTDGRFHSKWLNMMYPRLFLAKNLLRDDGVIFISIDDGEVKNLRALCDEIFGEENFVANLIWKKSYGGGSKSKYAVILHEYVLMYAKSKENLGILELPPDEDVLKYYKFKDQKYDQRGPFRKQPLATNSMDERPNLRFSINWEGNEIWPEKQWQWSKERVDQALSNDELVFTKKKEGWTVDYKQYLKNNNGEVRRSKLYSLQEGPYTQIGTGEIKELFGNGKVFTFPKPSKLIRHFTGIISKNDIILDFFSGSCSSAQAVLDLNKEDGGNRKFIMVQLPESCDENSEAYKAGYKTIADIGKERIRRVIKKIKEEQNSAQGNLLEEDKSALDLGFKVFKLAKSNFNLWNADVEKTPEAITEQLEIHVDHISPESSQESILYEILLKSGFELTTPLEKLTIEGKIVFSIAEGELLICLEKQLTMAVIRGIAERSASRVVCLDAGFQNNDQLKTNAVQIMKSHGVLNFSTV